MKKLITVTIILFVILAAGIAEIVATARIYDKLSLRLMAVQASMKQHEKHYDNPDTIQKIEEVLEVWEDNRTYIFVVNNHTTMRNLDEKLVMLRHQIQINAEQDAPVTLAVVINCINELKNDNYPKIINIF